MQFVLLLILSRLGGQYYKFSLLSFLILYINLLPAQSGSLDLTFGLEGKVTTDFENPFDFGEGLVVQPDGKIILVGVSTVNNLRDIALVRYESNGDLDLSFGFEGKVLTDCNDQDDIGRAIELQTDGKILVAGSTKPSGLNNRDFALLRYQTNGTLDPLFGSDGKAIFDFDGSHEIGSSMALQADGKILVAGSTLDPPVNRNFSMLRCHPDGQIDTSFGNAGIVITDFESKNDLSNAIAIQADGKIVLAGSTESGSGDRNFALARYDADGSLDNSFGTNGKTSTDFFLEHDVVHSLAIQNDGKILAAGSVINTALVKNIALARYLSDGSLDPSFGNSGLITTFLYAHDDAAESIAIQDDGKILVAGYTSLDTIDWDFALLRYLPDGSLDQTFDGDGIVTTSFNNNMDIATAMRIQEDHKILVAGYAKDSIGYDFALARYESDLSVALVEPIESLTEISVYPDPVSNEITLEFSLENEDTISILLFDGLGKLVTPIGVKQKRQPGVHKENLPWPSSLSNGIYFLVMDSSAGRTATKLVRLE